MTQQINMFGVRNKKMKPQHLSKANPRLRARSHSLDQVEVLYFSSLRLCSHSAVVSLPEMKKPKKAARNQSSCSTDLTMPCAPAQPRARGGRTLNPPPRSRYANLFLSYCSDLAYGGETKSIWQHTACLGLYLNQMSNIEGQWKMQSLPMYRVYKSFGVWDHWMTGRGNPYSAVKEKGLY